MEFHGASPPRLIIIVPTLRSALRRTMQEKLHPTRSGTLALDQGLQ
ncbi:hypothetical protein HRUBRA_01146 [Pseudohaliea rubra DSM 19751]|uniref:Uncharacterized protein n=1 Tax=Pseudohaliea rubra DSM 19751 TaxID=1265313 RepID=A0A095VS49_9GAMM|nr:hypothetical protein HRUBRA_01146 [Pseudohaliea rubra DSM 19751]